MEIVELMYKYINRFMTGKELLEKLKNIDVSNFKEEQQPKLKELIEKVENTVNTIPNEIDEREIKRKEQAQRLSERLKEMLSKENLNEKDREFIEKQYKSLLKEKEKTKDGGLLYKTLFEIMTQDDLVGYYASNMSDEELLDFITKYISVPNPPVISQKDFDSLVDIAIKKDKREALWRLAFNYNRKDKNFSKIEDYFIKVRDDFYIVELVSAVEEDLDSNNLAKKVISTNDKEFISKCVKYAKKIGLINDEDLKKLNLLKYLD